MLLKISDDVGSILSVGYAGEGHSVTRSVVSGGLQVLIESLVGPFSLASEGTTKSLIIIDLRVSETILGGRLSTENALQSRAGTVGANGVANSTEVLELFLTLSGVSSSFLLAHFNL